MKNFDKIKITELQVGDIYATELKLKGREAFLVKEIKS